MLVDLTTVFFLDISSEPSFDGEIELDFYDDSNPK